jgi:hypothetical protein
MIPRELLNAPGPSLYEFHGVITDKVRFAETGESYCYNDGANTGYPSAEDRIMQAVSCAVYEAKTEEQITIDSRALALAKHQIGEEEWAEASIFNKVRKFEQCQRWIESYDEAMGEFTI